MKIAFYGSSILSSYWNGAATYYRGLLHALAGFGHQITFYEPDVYDRQQNRDIDPPEWCRVVVYEPTNEALRRVADEAANADIVVKASGVGFADDELLQLAMTSARRDALRIYWDVDAPATLAELSQDQDHPLRQSLSALDLVLTYGGGDPVVAGYTALGAKRCIPVYNALDPATHHPVEPDPRFRADLALLANRLPDREERIEEFFFVPVAQLPDRRFLLGGSGWSDRVGPEHLQYIGHVPTRDHNAFNCSATAVLNVSRDSMAANGFSPATRVFEAAGAGACLITDRWEGLSMFLAEGDEVLSARDGQDVASILEWLTPVQARSIGTAARLRVMQEHTYAHRARQVHELLSALNEERHLEATG
jgi:spore maturation protein CgeB